MSSSADGAPVAVADFVRAAAERLGRAGVDSPRHDAETIVAFALGRPRGALSGAWVALAGDSLVLAERLVERRASRVPLQHLLGTAGFRYLELAVGPGVFVPRPETEPLAGDGIDELRRLLAEGLAHPRAVDLCTGSGAIAAVMASEAAGSDVTAVEFSAAAFDYAVRNAGPFGVDVRLGDMASAVDDLAGTVHVVTANPPYIPITEFESVAPEARDHDPALALWSGPDGLDAIRVVERVAARLLVPGGLVLCEHADSQSEAALAVFAGSGRWQRATDRRDLSGRPRYVAARRVPSAV